MQLSTNIIKASLSIINDITLISVKQTYLVEFSGQAKSFALTIVVSINSS